MSDFSRETLKLVGPAWRDEAEIVLLEAEPRRALARRNPKPGTISIAAALYLRALCVRFGVKVVAEIGTFIGTSALTMRAAGAEVYTCDRDNDCLPSSPGLTTFPYQGSTEMLEALVARGLKVDLFFFDGKIEPADLALIRKLSTPRTIYAFDDYLQTARETGKGVKNVGRLDFTVPRHRLIRPPARVLDLSSTTTIAVLVPMKADVSVVIPHYFKAREANLPIIVQALRAQTQAPTEVLVWNNDGPLTRALAGVELIQAPRNVGPKARFLAGLMATSDWILFQDNDLALRPRALENLLYWAGDVDGPPAIWSTEGRLGLSRGYGRSSIVQGSAVRQLTRVDMTFGRVDLVPRRLLPSILESFPFEPETLMDDLWSSWAATRAHIPMYVVPTPADAWRDDLADAAGGASGRPGYYGRREQVTSTLFREEASV